MYIGGTGQLLHRLHARGHAHKGSSSANQKGIDEDGQHLYQALLYRMGYFRSSCRVRSGAHAGLVGIQAALNAKHDAGAGKAGENSLKIKGLAKDFAQNSGQLIDIDKRQNKGYRNVDNAHNRHQGRRG